MKYVKINDVKLAMRPALKQLCDEMGRDEALRRLGGPMTDAEIKTAIEAAGYTTEIDHTRPWNDAVDAAAKIAATILDAKLGK